MLKEFRAFVLRGNVVDLAVGVVIGAAFTSVVNALVKDFVTPLIAAVGGERDFSQLAFTINGSRFAYGDFINELITFLLVASVVFFLVVKPMNTLIARFRPEPAADKPTRECTECLSSIPSAARRCAFCTAQQDPVPACGTPGQPDGPGRPHEGCGRPAQRPPVSGTDRGCLQASPGLDWRARVLNQCSIRAGLRARRPTRPRAS